MKRLVLAFGAALTFTGCGWTVASPPAGAPAPEGLSWEASQGPGPNTRLAKLAMFGPRGQRLLQLGPLVAYTPADIGSIRLILLRDTGGVPGPGGSNFTEVARSIRNNTPQTPYSNTVAIGNLKIGATYVVRSEAFAGPNALGEQIDTMVASDNTSLPFTAPGLQSIGGVNQIDTTPQVVSLPLVLKNKVFSGEAFADDGIEVINGNIENNSAPETIFP